MTVPQSFYSQDMGLTRFNFINLDKRQVHKIEWGRRERRILDPESDYWGWEYPLIRSLEASTPFYDTDTVLRQAFGYGLSSLVIDRSALGSFGKIPTELIHHILDAAGLHDGLMLSATNGQFFTICYPCIQARIKRVEATSFWSHDRVICIGQGETTLPDGCLTEDEKNAIMTWAFWYDFDFNEQDGERPGFCIPSKRLVKGTLNIIETEEYVHMCEDLGMTLYRYGCAMPALSDPDRLELAVPSKIIKADEVSKGDRQRIIQLRRLVVDRLGLEHPTLRRTDKVLVNITKREYVMATDREGRYVLEKAIPQLTCWGTKEGEHGDWAGDRLAVISCSELEEKLQQEEGWKEKVEQWDSDFE